MNKTNLNSLRECSKWLIENNHPVWAEEINDIIKRIETTRRVKNESKKRSHRKKRLQGLCREGGCTNKVDLPNSRCKDHLRKQSEKSAKKRKEMKDAGHCPRCYRPLLKDMDDGYITCLNCRERDLRIR